MTRLVEFLTLVPPCFFFFLFLFFSPPLPFLRRKKGERERGGRGFTSFERDWEWKDIVVGEIESFSSGNDDSRKVRLANLSFDISSFGFTFLELFEYVLF